MLVIHLCGHDISLILMDTSLKAIKTQIEETLVTGANVSK